MGKSKRSNQRKEYDNMILSRIVVRWEKSVFARKRKWTELPSGVVFMILQKMDSITILTKVTRLCRNWFELARNEPLVWRNVDLTCHGNKFHQNDLEDMACIAVNWSAGKLEEFSVEEFGSDNLLQYIAESTSKVKSINLINCRDISKEALVKTIKRWPLLEEIGLTSYYCSPNLCETIGRSCPRLKCFRLNKVYVHCDPDWPDDDEKDSIAKCIGKTMHGLRSLQLIGSRMRNKGLSVILQGCPQLEPLDIRNCKKLTISESIRSALEGIKHLRLPDESTDDYKFAHHVYTIFCTCCIDWSYNYDYNSDNNDYDIGDESDCDTENCSDITDWKLRGKWGVFQDWRSRGKKDVFPVWGLRRERDVFQYLRLRRKMDLFEGRWRFRSFRYWY